MPTTHLGGQQMTYKKSETFDKFIILFFRLTMGWTFLWAGIHHFGDSKFVLGFLSHVKTFHDVYAPLTNRRPCRWRDSAHSLRGRSSGRAVPPATVRPHFLQ